MLAMNQWNDAYLMHLVATRSRDEQTICNIFKAHPKYAKLVSENPSLKAELFDAVNSHFSLNGSHYISFGVGMCAWYKDGNLIKEEGE